MVTKFYSFINETISGFSENSDIETFTFNIDFRGITKNSSRKEQKTQIFNELQKHCELEILPDISFYINKWCYMWKIEMKNYSKNLFLNVDVISTYNIKYTYDITAEEFLKVGLKNVKSYLGRKNKIQKYNV